MSSIRTLFPYFNNAKEIYLDTAATSQRLGESLLAMNEYYETYNANVHRGNYGSAVKASNEYENARQCIASFMGARSDSEIIFTSGATDAVNLIANGLDVNYLQGSVILLCESEHHANFLPWQAFAATHSLILKKITLGKNGVFTDVELAQTLDDLNQDVAILAIAHVSNVLGNIYPIEKLCAKASQINALSVIDGTQAAAHIPINVASIDCDFYCLSGHKMYAGTGIGVLFGKMKWLEKLNPSKLGGEMITRVTWDSYNLQAPPTKFEAGTPNIAGALGLSCAANFIIKNLAQIQIDERFLMSYLLAQLAPLVKAKKLILLGNANVVESNSIALVSFYVPNMHANDVAMHLAAQKIAVRAGHHCAMPLMQALNIEGCVRLSMGCYTTKIDIDIFVQSLTVLLTSKIESENTVEDQNSHIKISKTEGIEIALNAAPQWNEKHRLLLLHSKQLSLLQEHDRLPEHEVIGCEAQVWLAICSGKLQGYSNSKVVRGILAVIINKLNELPKDKINQFDINAYLERLGLSHYFSKGRRDGIQKIISRINELF